MSQCLLCDIPLEDLCTDIVDWEYGVKWPSNLMKCPDCGLVTQSPSVQANEIESLYPNNYMAHSAASGSKSIYGKLKSYLANRTAKRIANTIPPNGTFLEIGCGNGQLLETLASLRSDVELIGVDIKQTGIDQLSNFAFHHGQFENVDIEQKSIDVIYCSNLIEHVPDPLIFVRKIFQSLKTEGLLLGVTPDHHSLDRFLFGRYWAGYHYPRHTFVFNHRNIVTLLQRSGFDRITTRGSYSFWALSFANRFIELPGGKKRGLLFALITAAFLPLDLIINLFRCHGSMTFSGRAGQ